MPTMFDNPQKLSHVEKTGAYGIVLHFESLSVKVVWLLAVLKQKHVLPVITPALVPDQILPNHGTTGRTSPDSRSSVAPPATHDFGALSLLDETLLPPQSICTIPTQSTTALPPHVVPQPVHAQIQKPEIKFTTKIFRGTLPTETDIASSTDFYWAEVPWRFRDFDFSNLPRFNTEIATYQALSATGIAPRFFGSGIFMHGERPGQSLSRCKFPTGLLLNLDWLRNALFQELPKLQDSTPHKGLFCGVIIGERCTCTLANLEGRALDYVRRNARLVQSMVDTMHLRMLQEVGVLHLDLSASNIGCCFSKDYQKLTLRILDFGKVQSNVCCHKLYSLPKAQRDEVIELIKDFSKNIVDSPAVLGTADTQSHWIERWFRV